MSGPLRVVFYGGRPAGVVGLLTVLAKGCHVVCVVPVDEAVRGVAEQFHLPVLSATLLNAPEGRDRIAALGADLLVCVHGRAILKAETLRAVRLGGINVHPCLYKYKGARPVERLLADGETRGSVGVHWMTEEVDQGPVLVEHFVDVTGLRTPVEVYNGLYPLYARSLKDALDAIEAGSVQEG